MPKINSSELNKKFVFNTKQKLDSLLKFLFEVDAEDYSKLALSLEAFKSQSEEDGIFSYKEYTFLEQLLVQEGLYTTQEGVLSLKGKRFWDDGRGGYVNQKKKQIADAEYLVNLQERPNQNDIRLLKLTEKLVDWTEILATRTRRLA